jgi:cell division transport system permease protein
MQLVGATNGFIRGPFVFEGLLAGVIGAAIALGLLVLAQHQLLPKLVAALPFVPLGTALPNPGLLAAELLGTGAAVGIVASWFSVGRYLRT